MSSPFAWPELSWAVPTERLPWLLGRTRLMGQRARAFELALEQAAAEGEASLSKIVAELEHWEALAAHVWMYAGLKAAQQLQPDEVSAHAEELAKVYRQLLEARQLILLKLGAGQGAAVEAREAEVQVGSAAILERAGELPPFTESSSPEALIPQPPLPAEVSQPVTPEEMRRRAEAERKPLPAGADLQACLAGLPPPWVSAVMQTLGLAAASGDEDRDGELTATSRSALQRRTIALGLDDVLLRQVVWSLSPEDRALIGELVEAGGYLRYSEVRQKVGADDADGFFWSERVASGVLARLRRTGLAYVGMREGKQVVALPADLIARLGVVVRPG